MLGPAKNPPALTKERIDRLLGDRSAHARAETAASVAAEFSRGQLTDRERALAESILDILAADIADEVRESLAEHVKHSPLLPPSIALRLAHDIESVALPILRYSEVLGDDALISVIRAGNESKQFAIAERATVSEEVSQSLVETGRKNVVCVLLANEGARIGEPALHRVLDDFDDDSGVPAMMVDRRTLPLAVSQRLVEIVSESLRQRLIERHQLPPAIADELSQHGRERAITQLIADEPRVAEVESMAGRLFASGKLTPSLLLRAICVGDLHFFEAGIARLAQMTIDDCRSLLYERGPLGFRGLYGKTDLPGELFAAFRVALDVVRVVRPDFDGGPREKKVWKKVYTDTIVERLVQEYRQVCPADVEHVLSQLARQFISGDGGDADGSLSVV
ncbi:MAG: DUF2336 domain-containing protein [Inquilinus sp.]|nr:DUF2336 domain-containing protein [Inquilinus sp.]